MRWTHWCGSTWLNWLGNREKGWSWGRRDRRQECIRRAWPRRRRRVWRCRRHWPPATPLMNRKTEGIWIGNGGFRRSALARVVAFPIWISNMRILKPYKINTLLYQRERKSEKFERRKSEEWAPLYALHHLLRFPPSLSLNDSSLVLVINYLLLLLFILSKLINDYYFLFLCLFFTLPGLQLQVCNCKFHIEWYY